MKKLILATLLLTSCAYRPVKPKPYVPKYKTKQEMIIECMEILRRMSFSENFIGETCKDIFKGF